MIFKIRGIIKKYLVISWSYSTNQNYSWIYTNDHFKVILNNVYIIWTLSNDDCMILRSSFSYEGSVLHEIIWFKTWFTHHHHPVQKFSPPSFDVIICAWVPQCASQIIKPIIRNEKSPTSASHCSVWVWYGTCARLKRRRWTIFKVTVNMVNTVPVRRRDEQSLHESHAVLWLRSGWFSALMYWLCHSVLFANHLELIFPCRILWDKR